LFILKEITMRVLKFIYESAYPYRLYLFGMVFAILVVSIDVNVRPYLIKLLIDTATNPESHDILSLVMIYAIFQILMISAWSFSDWCAMRYTCEYRGHIVSLMARRINSYAYTFFQDHLSGSIVAKINDAFSLIPAIIFVVNYVVSSRSNPYLFFDWYAGVGFSISNHYLFWDEKSWPLNNKLC